MLSTLEIYLILECNESVLYEYEKCYNKTRDRIVKII